MSWGRWVGIGVAVLSACGGGQRGERAPTSKANEGAAAACDRGDVDACSLLGTSLFLEAKATDGSFEPALARFMKACDGRDWHGCGMAAMALSATARDSRRTAAKAFPLAMARCREGDGGACLYVGDWAAKAGDRMTAAVHYRLACERQVAGSGLECLHEYACRKAVELGASEAELRQKATSGDVRFARRVQGEKDIQPDVGVARAMCKSRLSRFRAQFVVCLSDEGVPTRILLAELSGAPQWDQKLFESMRQWRYSPYVDAAGHPQPVCTGITFLYQPSC